jgi:excisionase family DNA binding protein
LKTQAELARAALATKEAAATQAGGPPAEPKRRRRKPSILPQDQEHGPALPARGPPIFPGRAEQDIPLSREEVAAYLRCSLPTLELWARNGEGPRVCRVGRSVRYRLSDVRAYVDQRAEP